MFAVLNARFPRPRTVTLVTTKPVFGPPLQLGRVNSDELLIVRSVLITVIAIQAIIPPAILRYISINDGSDPFTFSKNDRPKLLFSVHPDQPCKKGRIACAQHPDRQQRGLSREQRGRVID